MGGAEEDVGIFEYVSPTTGGIGGELKVLPSDFCVNELDSRGREVRHHPSPLARRRGSPDGAPLDTPTLLRFVLTKERMDTLGAVGELAALLGLPSRAFGVAGLKDYYAITSQRMSVHGAAAAALAAVRHPLLRVSRVRPARRPIRLGQLGGNRFRIRIRRAAGGGGGRRQIDESLGALASRGFVNYYGLQRFGDCAARNDAVGRCLLLADYAGAVDALLHSHGNEASAAEREARDVWRHTADARVAGRLMPRNRPLERELLKGLARQAHAALPGVAAGRTPALRPPRSCAQPAGHVSADGSTATTPSYEERCRSAVLGLPLSVRRLLAHSYFSKVWNIVASERLRRHGLAPAQEGELVLPPGADNECGSPFSRRSAVHVVTAHEASVGAYDCSAVVLPLPGADVIFPSCEVGRLFCQMLGHDGVEPAEPCIERSASRCDDENWLVLQGDYRRLIIRPSNLSWEVVPSTEIGHEQSDDLSGSHRVFPTPERDVAPEQSLLDVLVRFDLPPGAYATMGLREVMKLRPPPSHLGHIRFEE
ncbi:hypothetical protein AB1Y20_009157 [Prymnesium parvum]|uniref:TRUD domain-containing protein n=1 Tax=Prymnesium parvum TaxID=97485 RepID=A0AB34K3J0_PRYPA